MDKQKMVEKIKEALKMEMDTYEDAKKDGSSKGFLSFLRGTKYGVQTCLDIIEEWERMDK
nr:MAG TPA: hypothetical protein [Caudoviricetes sp.]